MAKPTEGEPGGRSLPLRIDWRVADGYPMSFANQLICQIASDEFVLTFGQLVPTALLNPTPEEIEALPETISPKIVARVAVTPDGLRRIIQVLQQQLNLYDSGVRGISETHSATSGVGQEE